MREFLKKYHNTGDAVVTYSFTRLDCDRVEVSLIIRGSVEGHRTFRRELGEPKLSLIYLELSYKAVAEATTSIKTLKQLFNTGCDEAKIIVSPNRLSVIARYDEGEVSETSTKAITEVKDIEYGYFNGILLYKLIKTLQDRTTARIRLCIPTKAEKPYDRILEITAYSDIGEIGHVVAPRIPDNEW